MPYTETKVSDWLTSNGWGQYISAFTSKSYIVLEDFGDTTADAEKAIADAVPNIGANDLTKMVTSWDTAVRADDATLTPSTNTPTGPVKATLKPLPPGTSVSLDGSSIVYPDESQIPFPTTLPTPVGGAHVDISGFTDTDWMLVAHYFKLLHAFDLNGVLADYLRATKAGSGRASSGAPRSEARRAVLDWKVPVGLSFVTPQYGTIDKTQTDFSITRRAMRSQMILDTSLDVDGPFCGVAIEAQYQENQGQKSTTKHLFMTASKWHPVVTLTLDDRCTTPSQGFIEDISNAVAKGTLTEQYDALSVVFDTYGHAFAREVTLGGSQYLMAEANSSLDLTDSLHQGFVKAALAGAVDGWKGTAGGSVQVYQGTSSSSDVLAAITEEATIGFGANDILGSSISNWGVIGWADLVPTADLLKDTNNALWLKVRSIWQNGRSARWGGTPPPGFADPLFYQQEVTLATPSIVTDPHKRLVVGAYPTGGMASVDDTERFWVAPGINDATALPGADRNKLLWKMRYAGTFQQAPNGGASTPLYWIVTADDKYYLAGIYSGDADKLQITILASPNPGNYTHPLDNAQAPEKSSAAWTIRRVDPYDNFRGVFHDSYVLTHWISNGILGPVTTYINSFPRFGLNINADQIPAHINDSAWLAQHSWEILPFRSTN